MDDGDTVASFISKLEQIRGQLVNLGDTTIFDQKMMVKILSQLPKQFEPFQPAWENVEAAQQTLTTMIVRLLRAESCMKEKEGITGGNATTFVANTSAISAGVSRTKNERDARKKEITDKKKITECWKCGEKDLLLEMWRKGLFARYSSHLWW